MDVSQIPTGCMAQANKFNSAYKDCVKRHPDGSMKLAGANTTAGRVSDPPTGSDVGA